MIFEQVKVGPMENFGYVIGDEGEGAIVDPGFEHEKLLAVAEEKGLKITKIVLTHSHFDHIGDLEPLHEKTKAEIIISAQDPYNLSSFENVTKLKDGETFTVGSTVWKGIHTPGHHPGEMCFLHEKTMISGDMLFVGGCGRVDLPGSDPNAMWHSMQKLQKYDDDIEIYPGHDYGPASHSSLGHEKKTNPYLSCQTKEEFFGNRL